MMTRPLRSRRDLTSPQPDAHPPDRGRSRRCVLNRRYSHPEGAPGRLCADHEPRSAQRRGFRGCPGRSPSLEPYKLNAHLPPRDHGRKEGEGRTAGMCPAILTVSITPIVQTERPCQAQRISEKLGGIPSSPSPCGGDRQPSSSQKKGASWPILPESLRHLLALHHLCPPHNLFGSLVNRRTSCRKAS